MLFRGPVQPPPFRDSVDPARQGAGLRALQGSLPTSAVLCGTLFPFGDAFSRLVPVYRQAQGCAVLERARRLSCTCGRIFVKQKRQFRCKGL